MKTRGLSSASIAHRRLRLVTACEGTYLVCGHVFDGII
jgi:hypothetical protein